MTSPLIEASVLANELDAPDIRIIDATWIPGWSAEGRDRNGRRRYSEGHIPNAVFMDIDAVCDTRSDLPHMLPPPEQFSSAVRKMGIGDGQRIVVYDSNGFMASARVWWMFRLMGKTDVRVLNGGLAAWQAAGGAVDTEVPPVSERHFTVRMNRALLRDMSGISHDLESKDVAVVDARPAGRFIGTAPEPRVGLESGHMPNAINVPSSELIDSDGRMVADARLRAAFGAALEKPFISTTCGSGVTAAILALGLAQIGRESVAVYDGSWSEWASISENRIVRETA